MIVDLRARLLRLAFLYCAALTVLRAQAAYRRPSLSVDQGRTEILLQPQNFLRLADHSRVEMISDALSNVKVALRGVAILDIGAVGVKSSVQAFCGSAMMEMLRPGIYRFECGRGELSDSLAVTRGYVRVTDRGHKLELTKNHLVLLTPDMKVTTLRERHLDAFDRWSASRAVLITQNRGQEAILKDTNKTPPAGMIIIPGENRGIPPN